MGTEILTKLKADLLDVKDSKLERMNKLRTHYENRLREHQEKFDAGREELEKKIAQYRGSNEKLRGSNQDDEAEWKKKARTRDREIKELIEKYDVQVREMAINLSEHQEMYKKDQRQLNELKEHFEKVDEEKACIAAEEAIADARRHKMETEKNRRNDDAALIQAVWRGIIQREQFTIMKKSKKKKGGGKKKK